MESKPKFHRITERKLMGKNGSKEKQEILYERPSFNENGCLKKHADSNQKYEHPGWQSNIKYLSGIEGSTTADISRWAIGDLFRDVSADWPGVVARRVAGWGDLP